MSDQNEPENTIWRESVSRVGEYFRNLSDLKNDVVLARQLSFVAMLIVTSIGPLAAFGQENFSSRNVLRQLDSYQGQGEAPVTESWWDSHVLDSMRPDTTVVPTDLHSLLYLALKNSAQLQVHSEVPLIRETSIEEARASFDWTKYLDTMWEDTDVPVGSSLTVGGAGTRFRDENFSITGGLRRRLNNGATVDLSQRIGHQSNNSNFFVPDDQGTAQLTLGVTLPLLRGSGRAYNESLYVLAGIDVQVAKEEFQRQLQSHLMEIARGYWSLYMERASLAQQIKLYVKTEAIHRRLESRRGLDAQPAQLASARAALENRLSDLVRAEAAVQNAETRLRALINAEELGQPDHFELLPNQPPTYDYYQADLVSEIETALQNRPEIKAALKEIRAGSIRLNVAKHELLPALNLVTESYLSGLRGNSQIGDALSDQYSDTPSYSVGLQYEIPIGNRAAIARKKRRQLELRQLQQQYRAALETVKAEVEVAVRELNTAYREMQAKQRSMKAAEEEVKTLEARWTKMVGENGTVSLALESLLRAQERVANSEREFSNSRLTYNLALINLSRVNGTLLSSEQIQEARACENGIPKTIFEKSDPSRNSTLIAPGDGVRMYEPSETPDTNVRYQESDLDYYRK